MPQLGAHLAPDLRGMMGTCQKVKCVHKSNSNSLSKTKFCILKIDPNIMPVSNKQLLLQAY